MLIHIASKSHAKMVLSKGGETGGLPPYITAAALMTPHARRRHQ